MASVLKVNGKWRVLIRLKGHRPICKTFPIGTTERAARAWGAKIEAELEAGRPVQLAIVTVASLIGTYRGLRDGVRPILDSSSEHYQLKTLERILGDRDAHRLTTQDLIAFATERRDEGAGPYTVNMDLSKLSTVMRYAASARGLTLPDAVGVARPLLKHLGHTGGGGRRERRPTEDELQRIVEYLAKNHGQVYTDAVLFAAATAMRRGEVCRIAWADVDAVKRLVLVRDRKDPRKKAGNDQWVPLLPGAWALLEQQPRGDEEPRIFPLHPQTLSKYFTGACTALGIPDLHLHDMRHEGTSRLFEDGYTIEQVALVTGHKKWDNLRRYTQLRAETLHRHADAPTSQTV